MAKEPIFSPGDTIFNIKAEQIGTIVASSQNPNNKNKYEIKMLDWSPNIELEENFIHQTRYHKEKKDKENKDKTK